MREFLIRWFLTAVSVVFAVWLIPGIESQGITPILLVGLLLGLVNAFIRPVLLLLSLPLILVSLGFFALVINAFLFWGVASIVPGFQVSGFWSALGGGLVVGIVCWALSIFFRGSNGEIYLITHHQNEKRVTGRVVGDETGK